MFIKSKALIVGLAVLLIITYNIYFSNDDNINYEYSGIVHDISKSKSGFTFYLDSSMDGSIFCYNSDEPIDLGHYRINGTFSENGSIYFVDKMYYVDS